MKPIVLSTQDIIGLMTANGIVSARYATFDDNYYAVPSEEWVGQKFGDSLRSFFHSHQRAGYKAESRDCDNYAKGAAYWAKELHASSDKPAGYQATDFAICECRVNIDGEGLHKMNLWIVRRGDSPILLPYEPQIQNFRTLKPWELQKSHNHVW